MLNLRGQLHERWVEAKAAVGSYFQKSPAHARVGQLLLTLERHNSLRTASAMAFDLFMAIVPMLGLAGYAASHLLRSQPKALIEGSRLLDLAPAQFRGFIFRNVSAFAETEVAPLFIVLALWLSSSAFFTMIRVFEESFDCEPRNWISARLLALAFASTGLALFVAAAAAGALATWQGIVSDTSKHRIFSLLHLSPDVLGDFEPFGLLAFAGCTVGITGYLALIYRFAVVRKGTRRRYLPGAIVASTVGLVGSFLLAYYVTNLGRYALFYGSLAVIVVILLWLWLWCSAILIGAEINVALEDALAPALPESALQESAVSISRQGAGADPVGPTHTPSVIGNPDGD
jgi:membrane protein